ncbi:hypothetical protein WJX74_009463 [Apatococcus lobatus]|uniref:Uncharacterized protein n=1 Tax=Apatococcus lobatus TaxID=904363 RepID=A0AAW1SBB3_9CHLO
MSWHTIPLLKMRDAQAISQTCSSLRRVVHTGLPATTWSSLARRTFPPAHPILAVDSVHMQTEVAQLAQFHASVRSGKCVATAKGCILQGNRGHPAHRDDSPAYLSHSGKLFLCQQAENICLYSLSLECASEKDHDQDEELMASLLFSQPTMEDSITAEYKGCSFFWSPDDSWVAIWYTVRDYSDPRAVDFNANAIFAVVYIFQVATKQVFAAMHTKDIETLAQVSVSPDSKLLFLAWDNYTFNGSTIDIYDPRERRVQCSVRDEASQPGRLSLSPCSKYFAMPPAANVHVYSTDGLLKTVLKSALPANKPSWEQVAWSPDELHLAIWQPGSPSAMCIFETECWTFVRSIAVEEPDFGAGKEGAGLLWGLLGLMPMVRSLDQ